MTQPSEKSLKAARELGQFWQWGEGQVRMVAEHLDAAVAAERERCAKVAEEGAAEGTILFKHIAPKIAAAIRQGGKGEV
jgi:hypothetical protein